eukprot:jgi/Galph1/1215/GphlegSOOS_G6087.1
MLSTVQGDSFFKQTEKKSVQHGKFSFLDTILPACKQEIDEGDVAGSSKKKNPVWSGLLIGTIVVAFLVPYLSGFLTSDNGLSEEEIALKLHQVPVFAVTDSEGKPFLLENPTKKSDREGYFFLDKDDALSFRDFVVSQNTEIEPKVFPLTLDVAEKFVQGKVQSMTLNDHFHLTPNEEDLEYADQVLKSRFDRTDVPVFVAEKLILEFDGRTPKDERTGNDQNSAGLRVTPLFLRKQDLDSVLHAAAEKGTDASQPAVRVFKLSELLRVLRSGEFGSFDDFIFYPSEEALNYIRSLST